MKKMGLCVRYDCDNYGSMLQIFATQKVITQLGWEYEIIVYDKKNLLFLLKNLSRIFNPYFMEDKIMLVSKKLRLKKYPEIEKNNKIRKARFAAYRDKYIGPYSKTYKGYANLVRGADEYDAVMVGSDQLWTPAGIKSKFYNLLFVPDNVVKISFATSFGVANIPYNQIKETKKYLNRIDYISVRETRGASIVKELTGREAVVALDPTLMFDRKQWEKFFPFVKRQEEYIFAYFLGKNSEHRDIIKEFQRKTGLKVITCPHLDDFVEADLKFGDRQAYDVDPVDFLNLIRNATYVVTDSFHGSVFSILNHKQFMVFNRFADYEKTSKNSRIESLCKLLKLESRRYDKNFELLEQIDRTIDYEFVDNELEKYRKETYEFVSRATKEKV